MERTTGMCSEPRPQEQERRCPDMDLDMNAKPSFAAWRMHHPGPATPLLWPSVFFICTMGEIITEERIERKCIQVQSAGSWEASSGPTDAWRHAHMLQQSHHVFMLIHTCAHLLMFGHNSPRRQTVWCLWASVSVYKASFCSFSLIGSWR